MRLKAIKNFLVKGDLVINKRGIGSEYEAIAVSYLLKKGYEIIELNFRCSFGEIDIIAKDGDVVSFIEVKYRNSLDYWDPGEAITSKKQNIIFKVAQVYLKKNQCNFDNEYRFDVVLVLPDKIRLIKNAFGGL